MKRERKKKSRAFVSNTLKNINSNKFKFIFCKNLYVHFIVLLINNNNFVFVFCFFCFFLFFLFFFVFFCFFEIKYTYLI